MYNDNNNPIVQYPPVQNNSRLLLYNRYILFWEKNVLWNEQK